MIIYPARGWIADVFADDPEIIYETTLFLEVILPALPFFAMFINAVSAGRGSGHTLFPTVLGVTRLWVLRLAVGYVLAFPLGMGSLGIWLAVALSHIIGGVASLIWLKYGKWVEAVIEKPSISEEAEYESVFNP